MKSFIPCISTDTNTFRLSFDSPLSSSSLLLLLPDRKTSDLLFMRIL